MTYFPYFQVKHVKPEKRNILIRSQIKGDIFSEENIDKLDTMFRPYQCERLFPSTCIISKKIVSVRKTTFWESSICLSPKSSRQISESKVIHLRNEHQEKNTHDGELQPKLPLFCLKNTGLIRVNSLIWVFKQDNFIKLAT